METLHVVAFYTALFLIFFMMLSLWVIVQRNVYKVKLGEGGAPALQQAIRMHGNFCENVPFALLGLWGLAFLGLSGLWIHILGSCLLVARLAHAWGLWRSQGRSPGRSVGVGLTWLVLSLESFLLLRHAFS